MPTATGAQLWTLPLRHWPTPSPNRPPVPRLDPAARFNDRLIAWIQPAIILTLLVLLFWPNLRRLWEKTNPFYGEPNWSHSIFVPVIGLFYLYLNRRALLAAPRRGAWSGLAIILAGISIFAYGVWPGQNDFLKDFGMMTCLFGTVTLLLGWEVMRIAWFPIVFLICAFPWPGLVYGWVAGPLQRLAAHVAVETLRVAGIDAVTSGTKIVIDYGPRVRTLNVAEACAGLRSLMTFVAIAAGIAFLSVRPLWQRLLIVLSAPPIAVLCNVMRVSVQGLLDRNHPDWSEGFAHMSIGLVMMLPAFFMLLFVAYVVDHLFVDADARDITIDKNVIRRPARHPAPGPAATISPAPSEGRR